MINSQMENAERLMANAAITVTFLLGQRTTDGPLEGLGVLTMGFDS